MPILWQAEAANGGVSEAKPWLPAVMEQLPLSVDRQKECAGSMLSCYPAKIAFPNCHPALVCDDEVPVSNEEDRIVFERWDGSGKKVLCMLNLSAGSLFVPLSGSDLFLAEDQPCSQKFDAAQLKLVAL
jgi:alpha-glucosidase